MLWAKSIQETSVVAPSKFGMDKNSLFIPHITIMDMITNPCWAPYVHPIQSAHGFVLRWL